MAKKTNKSSRPKQDWNEIGGVISLYANENKSGGFFYSTTLSRKDEDGEYENLYLTVRMSKACEKKCEPEKAGPFYLMITEAFLKAEFWTSRKSKERQSAVVLFINDAEPMDVDL